MHVTIATLRSLFGELAQDWSRSKPAHGVTHPPIELKPLASLGLAAHALLMARCQVTTLGTLQGLGGSKAYVVFKRNGRVSRPFRRDFLFSSKLALRRAWSSLVLNLDLPRRRIKCTPYRIDKVLYALTHSVACAYDIFTKGDRTTAGKYFEYVLGSLVTRLVSGRLDHPPRLRIPRNYDVEIDVTVAMPGRKTGFLLATKLTSRERVVQPFVHRFMVHLLCPRRYRAVILCGSETNKIKKPPWLQETCVHNTIEAYGAALGWVNGLYYLDLPRAYARSRASSHMEVSTLGRFLSTSLRRL